jgi:hypothetical protein
VEDTAKKSGFLQPFFKKIRETYKHPFTKEIRIFLIFLVVSFFFWALQSLQEIREVDVRVPLVFNELSSKVSVTNELPTYLTVTLSDKGTNLYYYYRHRKELFVRLNVLDYYNKQDIGEIPVAVLESMLRKKLMPSTQLLRINPEGIKVYFAQKQSTEIPVRLISDLTFAAQHLLTDTPDIHPATIRVFAPASVLRNIKYIETETLILEGLKDTTLVAVPLKPIPGVRFAAKSVDIRLCVEEFTERSFLLPVTGAGFPAGSSLLAFPSSVKVTFFLGVSVYSMIKPSDFELAIDYKDLMSSKNNLCKIRLVKQPTAVQNIRIQPASVECLLEKNP